MASRKAKANPAATLPHDSDIPEGMQAIGGGYADTWTPETEGEKLHGVTTGDVKVVLLKARRKNEEDKERRCVEIANNEDGKRYTVWESAALGAFFDALEERGEGTEVFLRYEGLGKKKAGQNPPKLFKVAIAA